MVMFHKIETEARKELKELFNEFVKTQDYEGLKAKALTCEQKYSGVSTLSEEVSKAGYLAIKIVLKELTKDEAKQVLKSLD